MFLEIYNLQNKLEYLDEVAKLEYEEWAINKEEKELTPWYATMYVKKEHRNHGYSRILNEAILSEAKNRNYKTIYLKTDLENYYEKFGAVFMKKIKSNESLYKFEL